MYTSSRTKPRLSIATAVLAFFAVAPRHSSLSARRPTASAHFSGAIGRPGAYSDHGGRVQPADR